MAVFTFSTKDSKPEDTELVQAIKEQCEKEHKNFSAIVVDLLRAYKQGAKVNG